MRSYDTARTIFGFLEFFFWCGVGGGFVLAFAALDAAGSNFGWETGIVAAMPGLFVSVISLLGVAVVENARAGVDTAELTQQALKVSRDQLEVSKQALRQGEALQASFTALVVEKAPTSGWSSLEPSHEAQPATISDARVPATLTIQPNGDLQYRGMLIRKGTDGYYYNGQMFGSPEQVAQALDEVPGNKPLVLRAER